MRCLILTSTVRTGHMGNTQTGYMGDTCRKSVPQPRSETRLKKQAAAEAPTYQFLDICSLEMAPEMTLSPLGNSRRALPVVDFRGRAGTGMGAGTERKNPRSEERGLFKR